MDLVDRGILTQLADKHVHFGDKHDSTYELTLEETKKDTVKSMQTQSKACRHQASQAS